MAKAKIECPECGDSEHLYLAADFRYNPESGKWEFDVIRDDGIDCTECDASFLPPDDWDVEDNLKL